MQDFDKILLSQLRDVHSLSGVSMWPLAPGWWLLLFVFITSLFVITKKIIKVKQYRKSWRYKLEQQLDKIASETKNDNAKENIGKINDLLKRLAIQNYGRKESAALNGKKWLVWLSNQDPKNFNWLQKGQILIEYPYMPEDKIKANHENIIIIAKAAKAWLKTY